MRISAELTLRQIIRIRPRFLELLEQYSGSEYWNHLDFPLSEFCERRKIDLLALLAALSTLPIDPPGTSWSNLPLYRLVDRLTRDHEEFREVDLPAIESLLFTSEASAFPADYPQETLKREFHSFKMDLLLHMEEEEGFLFPKALRTEGSLNHPSLPPEIFKGSVSAYPKNLLQTPEAELLKMISDLHLQANWPVADEAYPLLGKIERSLKEFEAKVAYHAELESEALLARTLKMEKRLVARSREE